MPERPVPPTYREYLLEAVAVIYVLQERRTTLTAATLILELSLDTGDTDDRRLAATIDSLVRLNLLRFDGPYVRPGSVFDPSGMEDGANARLFPPRR